MPCSRALPQRQAADCKPRTLILSAARTAVEAMLSSFDSLCEWYGCACALRIGHDWHAAKRTPGQVPAQHAAGQDVRTLILSAARTAVEAMLSSLDSLGG